MKSILVPIEDHDRMGDILDTTLLLARQFDSYIEGIVLGPDLAEMVAADFSMSGALFDDRMRATFFHQAREIFESFMARNGIPRRAEGVKGVSFGWTGDALVTSSGAGEYGRVFDVLAVGRPGSGPNDPHSSTLEGALFESGRPVLIAPPKAPTSLGTTTVIVWDRTPETTRSIAFATLLLRQARDLIVLDVPGMRPGPTAAQLVQNLCRRDLPARVVPVKESKTPGLTLLETAASLGADLMIKGGYTQSRLRKLIFGSLTSEILAQAELAVLMAH